MLIFLLGIDKGTKGFVLDLGNNARSGQVTAKCVRLLLLRAQVKLQRLVCLKSQIQQLYLLQSYAQCTGTCPSRSGYNYLSTRIAHSIFARHLD